MLKEQVLLSEKKDGIATLTMNRPKAYNALSPELISRLTEELSNCEKDPEVKVVVLTGSGKAFCAGGDLPYIESLDNLMEGREYILSAGRLCETIFNLSKPVIAMVNGVAAGAGFNLVLACDLVVCAENVKFVQSFAKVGLVPDCGGAYLLPRVIGLPKAKELMFLAEPLEAEEALKLGIVNQVVGEAELQQAAGVLAARLSHGAAVAIGLTKRLVNQGTGLSLNSALELEADLQTLCLQTSDHKEGVAAFKEKRSPVFKGM